MISLHTVKKSRPLQIFIAIVVLLIYFLFLRGSSGEEAFTPEELNSILQNKKKDIVEIVKKELFSQRLEKPYLDPSSLKSKWWHIKGNTIVKNNDYIRLTSDIPQQAGSIFSKLPIQASSFEMEVDFSINGKSNNGLMGDGFAIWLTDNKLNIGEVFGSQNYFNGLGIFIDTYKNGASGNFPYTSLMLGDGKTFYNKATDGEETRLGGCTARGLYNSHSGHSKLRIVYIKDGYFSLDFDYRSNGNWKNCVTVNDLKLPVIKYLGFSAETGELTENVDIYESHVYSLYKDDNTPISSVSELESMMIQHEDRNLLNEDFNNSKKRGSRARRRRKANETQKRRKVVRLQKNYERIKKKEALEKAGKPSMFAKIWYFFKMFFYSLLVLLTFWIAYVIYRVQRQKRRRTTGLII